MINNRFWLLGLCMLFVTITASAQKTAVNKKKQPAEVYNKTQSGLQYKIYKDATGGSVPELGGFMTFWFQLRTDKDSIADNQMNEPNPVGIPIPEITYKPSIEEGFYLLSAGDSAAFLLNADSLYANTFRQALPSYLKPGSYVKMLVKTDKVYSKHFVDSVMAIQEQQQKANAADEWTVYQKDSAAIQHYLTRNKLKGEVTPSGAYVVKLEESTFSKSLIKSGESVRTSYIGTLLLDGKEFDRSRGEDYFKFTVGEGQVIKGWDEGFLKLKRGDHALILIPSRLAYGPRGAGSSIPPNAPLLFEVEVQK